MSEEAWLTFFNSCRDYPAIPRYVGSPFKLTAFLSISYQRKWVVQWDFIWMSMWKPGDRPINSLIFLSMNVTSVSFLCLSIPQFLDTFTNTTSLDFGLAFYSYLLSRITSPSSPMGSPSILHLSSFLLEELQNSSPLEPQSSTRSSGDKPRMLQFGREISSIEVQKMSSPRQHNDLLSVHWSILILSSYVIQ